MTLNSSIPLWIFGLDTGDVEMIRHWVRQGHLPAIGSLLGRGCWAVVNGPEMVAEYGAALTLFSGVSRADHGYYYMRQLQPGTYNLVRVDPEDVQDAPPFWAHLAGANRRVLIIDVPDIALVPGLPGFQISNWGTHHSPRDPATTQFWKNTGKTPRARGGCRERACGTPSARPSRSLTASLPASWLCSPRKPM